MRISILKDENIKGKEKAIFTIFSVRNFLEHNITYCEVIS